MIPTTWPASLLPLPCCPLVTLALSPSLFPQCSQDIHSCFSSARYTFLSSQVLDQRSPLHRCPAAPHREGSFPAPSHSCPFAPVCCLCCRTLISSRCDSHLWSCRPSPFGPSLVNPKNEYSVPPFCSPSDQMIPGTPRGSGQYVFLTGIRGVQVRGSGR